MPSLAVLGTAPAVHLQVVERKRLNGELWMSSGEARFARVRQGLSFVAEVALEVEIAGELGVTRCACTGRGFVAQGHLEEVPGEGYDDWKAGGRAGVDFAVSVAALPHER